MERLKDIMAGAFTICFVMGLGASAYHQHEVLTKQDKVNRTYTYSVNTQDEYDSGETVIEVYANEYTYSIYEMAEDDVPEEEYWDSLELLAACVEAEAGNQGLLGKRLVVDVVLNRVDSPDFPDSIEEVIKQPRHFTSYWNGMIDSVDITEESFKAVEMELEERSYPSLLYFTSDGYSQYGTPWKKVGDHYFSTK